MNQDTRQATLVPSQASDAPEFIAVDGANENPADGPVVVYHQGRTLKRKIVVASEKGGVGKTSVTDGIVAVASEEGSPITGGVVAIDFDTRPTVTAELDVEDARFTTVDLMTVPKSEDGIMDDPAEMIHDWLTPAGKNWPDRVRVLATSRDLANFEMGMAAGAEHRLHRALQGLEGSAELIVVDSPPRTGSGNLMKTIEVALDPEDLLIIPIFFKEDAIKGMAEFIRSLMLFSQSTMKQLPEVIVVANDAPTKMATLEPVTPEWRKELMASDGVKSVHVFHLNNLYTQLAAVNEQAARINARMIEKKIPLRFPPVRLLKSALVSAANREWARTYRMPITSFPKTSETVTLVNGYRNILRFALTGEAEFVDIEKAAAAAKQA